MKYEKILQGLLITLLLIGSTLASSPFNPAPLQIQKGKKKEDQKKLITSVNGKKLKQPIPARNFLNNLKPEKKSKRKEEKSSRY